MIEKMTRYDFILLSGETEAFLQKLQEVGVVDITRSFKPVDAESAALLSEAEELKKKIAWLEAGDYSQDETYSEISASIAALVKEKALREPWGEFDKDAITRLEAAGQKLHFHAVAKKKFDQAWAERYPLEVIRDENDKVWFVTVTPAGEAYDFPVPELAVPEGSAGDADESIAALQKELAGREGELQKEAEGLPELHRQYRKILADFDFYLANVAKENAAEDMLTVFTGFAPSENDALLEKEFESLDALCISEKACVDDNPPIKLKNNKFVSMFEVLTDMYGRPAYNGFDPTPYISIFFLLFFAMCMGDAGYGIILVIVGLLLRKVKSFASLAPLVVTLGVGTFVVGFFFHTFFSVDISQWGFIQDAGLDKVMVPSQIAGYDGTMVLALIIGIIHLCLAMIVKTVEATKNQGFLNSLGTWGWTLLIVGGVIVGAIALCGVLDSAVTKWIIIVLGIISAIGIFLLNDIHRNPLLNIGSGLWEAYNTATGVLGDVLSYLRLYALGLAGGMLGQAFNSIASTTLGDGGFGWIPFILIVVIGHVLNIAMAALGAFVHPLRLNFLEFFKNSGYEGVGRNYNPLKK